MEKMTYVSALNDILAMKVLDEDHVAKVNAMIAHFKKQGSYKRVGLTKVQRENEHIKVRILNSMLDDGSKYSISEMISMFPCLSVDNKPLSTQKVSPLVHSLLNAGCLNATVEKGKTYYSKVAGATYEERTDELVEVNADADADSAGAE